MSDVLAFRLASDVSAAAHGGQQAFARLVDATRNTVASITLAILRDVELSRDVAQEVYMMVWRDLRKLRDPVSFLPWIRQIARNRAHQALRANVRNRRRVETLDDDLLAAASDPRPDLLQALITEEECAALASTIDALPPASREVVILYYREGRGTKGKAGTVAAAGGGALFGAFAGLIGGWIGVLFGIRGLLRLARDADERRGIVRAAAASMSVLLVFVAAIVLRPTSFMASAAFAATVVCFFVIHFIWLPRGTSRRHAAELIEDPVGAASFHRARGRSAALGFVVGITLGAAAIVAAQLFK